MPVEPVKGLGGSLPMSNPWAQRLGVWSIAELHPSLPAIVECPAGETLTFSELAARAHQTVHAMRAAGMTAGDSLAISLPNDVDIVVWQLAASEAGWRYFTVDPRLSSDELGEILIHSEAKALVVHADACRGLSDAGHVAIRIAVGGTGPAFVDQKQLLAGHPMDPPADRTAGTPIVYTSGTTGKAKAILHPTPPAAPDDLADAMKTFGHAFRFQPLTGAHLVSAGMHHGGCRAFYMGALHVGQALVIMSKFDPEGALRMIEKHHVTTGYMVPTQFVRLLRLPAETRRSFDLSSLESVVHSAAPCPPQVKAQMMDWWGPVIWETYGGTEGAATIASPQRWLEKPGTVGRAIKGMTVRILDDDGVQLEPNELGNVYLESQVGGGFSYHRDPEQTAAAYRGKAFTLGDIGYLDDDGFLFIADRKKDMIISGGVNIYPAEIESVLLAHPAVADTAVLGAPDPEWGEQVRAVVQPSAAYSPSPELADELIAYCRGRLASYKCPRRIEFHPELPRTETGKLAKRALREELWAGADRQI
jgi:long-chain acyl-CoA synthetase